MKRVTFVVSELSAGGAARVLSVLANHFAAGDEVDVGVITHVQGSGYDLDPRIRWRALYAPEDIQRSLVNKVWRRVEYWPKLLRTISAQHPDTVVAFLRGMNWRIILLCRVLGIRVIATEHTNHLAEAGFFSWLERRWIYLLSDALVVLTEFDRKHYASYLSQVRLIPNPLSFASRASAPSRKKVILAVGDVNRWHIKGFDRLIDAFAAVAPKFPDWSLRIVGPGDVGRTAMEDRARCAGLADRVEFSGFSRDVDRHMAECEIFAMTSRYEGFSMALLEAMFQGCACVSFDCNAGPRDLLQGGSGLLVPDGDVEGLALELARLMGDQALRRDLSGKASQAALAYSVENVAKRWLEVC